MPREVNNTGVDALIDFGRRYCLHVFTRLRDGAVGYVPRYRLLIVLLLLTAVADVASTIHFMTRDGIDQELHPGFRLACLHLGPLLGAPLAKLMQLAAVLVVTLYWRHIAHLILFATAMMYGWAAWYNVFGRDIYTPLLFAWLN